MRLYYIFIFIFLLGFKNSTAQDENSKQFVHESFSSLKLINAKTTKTIPKKSFVLNIQHRFGKADLQNDLVKNFFGLDLSSNIRFAFGIPITDRLYVGVGRTKTDKVIDFEGNYTFYKQTIDNNQPVTLALHSNLGLQTDDFPEPLSNWVTEDSSAFKYKFNHRLTYYTQLTVARKFTDWLSMQVAPFFVYKNLVKPGYENSVFGVTAGGRIKTGFSSSIVFEYSQLFNKPAGFVHPFAIGYEIGTAGHSFQITVSTSNSLINQQVFSTQNLDIFDGTFYLGFNIYRTFYIQR